MNNKFEIKQDVFCFRCSEKDFETFKRIGIYVFDENSLLKVGEFSIRINSQENIQPILALAINNWIVAYHQKSDLEKDLEKFFFLEDLRKNIMYGFSLGELNTGDEHIMGEIYKINEATQKMTFIFLKIAQNFEQAIEIIKAYDEPDEGDRIDKIDCLNDFREIQQNFL